MDALETTPPENPDRTVFDAAAYLRMYPDIGEAIARGVEVSAWDHYDRHGRAEGRHRPCPPTRGTRTC